MEKALDTILKALAIEPDFAPGLVHLREIRPEHDFAPAVALVERKIAAADPAKPEAVYREHLFLGKYFNGRKEHEKAFRHFRAYNELRFEAMKKAGTRYDPALMEENFRETKKIFNRGALARLRETGSASELPVFIIGMPRSGTTLLEQILSTHPLVHGRGELGALTWVFLKLNHLISENPKRDIYDIIREEAGAWQKLYLDAIKAPPGASRTTDKMPVNFIYLGIIEALFPKGRIVHIRRSPLDTCFSMYTNFFSEVYAYSARLEELGHFYNLYADLMAYWKKTLTMRFFEVQYEDLVNDPEAQVKAVLEFCGLPWDPAVLEFHKGKKSAFTLSQVQVSRPINKASFARWKPYEKHIQPLIRSLDPAIVGPLDMTGKKR